MASATAPFKLLPRRRCQLGIRTDSGNTWTAGSGSSFVLPEGTYASGDIQVRQTDLAGNTSGAAQNTAEITIDATAPVAPSFGLNLDSGSSSSDGIGSDGTIQVASLEDGASWEYNTDSGNTWTAGSAHPLSFQGTYASGDIQVRQTDLAGNTSGAAQNTAEITNDIKPETVRSSTNRTLPDNVENLVLTGATNLKGYGNGNNRLTGNAGNNLLDGKGG